MDGMTGPRPVLLAVLLALALGIPPVARAQEHPTAQERAACGADVHRLCQAAVGGDTFSVLACLRKNRAQLSKACAALLSEHGL